MGTQDFSCKGNHLEDASANLVMHGGVFLKIPRWTPIYALYFSSRTAEPRTINYQKRSKKLV